MLRKKLAAMIAAFFAVMMLFSMTALADTADEETRLMGTVFTDGTALNVRSDAGMEFPIISYLENGTTVWLRAEKNGWYLVEVPNGFGYVWGGCLVLSEQTVPVQSAQSPEETEEDKNVQDPQTDSVSDDSHSVHGLTPSGNLTMVDDLGQTSGAGQQFITLVTKSGNYFYLVIDRDEQGRETVHFLNLVDEQDLFALMEDDEVSAVKQQQEEKASREAAEKEASEKAERSETSEGNKDSGKKTEDKSVSEKKKPNTITLILVGLFAIAGISYFFMQKNKKKQASMASDPDVDDPDDEDYGAGTPSLPVRKKAPLKPSYDDFEELDGFDDEEE